MIKVLFWLVAAFVGFFLIFVVLYLGAAALGRSIGSKYKAKLDAKAEEILTKVNEEHGTNFVVGKNRDLISSVFFDQEKRKIYITDAYGLSGLKDYSFFTRWTYRSYDGDDRQKPYHYIEITTKDVDVPLIRLDMASKDIMLLTYARLNALMAKP